MNAYLTTVSFIKKSFIVSKVAGNSHLTESRMTVILMYENTALVCGVSEVQA